MLDNRDAAETWIHPPHIAIMTEDIIQTVIENNPDGKEYLLSLINQYSYQGPT